VELGGMGLKEQENEFRFLPPNNPTLQHPITPCGRHYFGATKYAVIFPPTAG